MDYFESRKRIFSKCDLPEELNALSELIIGASIEVHRTLGPGLHESIYELALCHELDLRGIPYARQELFDVIYKGKLVGQRRVDLIVAGKIVVDLKSVETMHEVFRAQVLCYLGITGLLLGLVINFNVPRLVDGVGRVIRTLA